MVSDWLECYTSSDEFEDDMHRVTEEKKRLPTPQDCGKNLGINLLSVVGKNYAKVLMDRVIGSTVLGRI